MLLDGCDETTTSSATKVLEAIAADREYANALLSGPLSSLYTYTSSGADALLSGPLFTYASNESAVEAQYVRALTSAGPATPVAQILLLDNVEFGAFYVSDETTVTDAGIRGFLRAFKEGHLESARHQISAEMRRSANALVSGDSGTVG